MNKSQLNFQYKDDNLESEQINFFNSEPVLNNENLNLLSDKLNEKYFFQDEQLDFLSQNNINLNTHIIPQALIYNSGMENKPKTIMKSKNSRSKIDRKINKYKYFDKKNKKLEKSSKPIFEVKPFVYDNATNPKGLFDPNLKSREIDRKNNKLQQQRDERKAKINNYNIKFKDKVNNFQVYNNYQDLLSDIINDQENIEFVKKSNKQLNKHTVYSQNMLPKPNYSQKNNLNFYFSDQEHIIKELEENILNERKLRAEMNIKYSQKINELREANKTNNNMKLSNQQLKIQNNTKLKDLDKLYKSSNSINKNFNHKDKYLRDLNTSINYIKRPQNSNILISNNNISSSSNHKHFYRNKSTDNIKSRLLEFEPVINKIVNNNIDNLYKDNLKKFEDVRLHSQTQMKNKRNIYYNSQKNYKDRRNKKNKETVLSTIIQVPNLNSGNFPISKNTQENLLTSFYNNNQNKDKNIISSKHPFLIESNFQYDNNINDKVIPNKSVILQDLSHQIEKYNKGIPQLTQKVEETLNKLNQFNVFDENTHPIIKIASKHSGQLIHFHLEELTESILDDILYECVDELNKIEELNNKKENKRHFQEFVNEYSKNIENFNLIEERIKDKLDNKYNFISLKPKAMNDRKDIFIYANPFESNFLNDDDILSNNNNNINSNQIMKRKNFDYRKYKILNHNKLVAKIEKEANSFDDYLKSIGTYFYKNIFLIYEDLVNEITKELVEDEIRYCIKQIDEFATGIYKEELFKSS